MRKDKEGVKKCINITVEGTSLKGHRTTWLRTVQKLYEGKTTKGRRLFEQE